MIIIRYKRAKEQFYIKIYNSISKMKPNKFWSIIYMFIFVLITAFIITSCGTEEDDFETSSNSGGISVDKSSTIDVVKYVKSSSDYNDYQITITFSSTLENAYPDKRIDYLLSFGYNGEYSFVQRCSNFNGQFGTISAAIFFNSNGFDYTKESMYAKSYVKLKEIKESRDLYDDELSLWNEIARALNSAEPKAKQLYNGRFCVEVDGERYVLKEYRF